MENECITVTVNRITFHNKESGYYVLKTTSKKDRQDITIVGNFAVINPGEELRVYGTWTCHPSFGEQFHSLRYNVLKPSTLKGIEKYLGSGLIKGVGPATAKKLVEQFGFETLDILEKQPEKLCECPGIGSNKANIISAGWFKQRAIGDVMIFLQGHGISPVYATKIFKKYDRNAIKKVSQNPYILADEIPGMGFKKADAIASEFGITGNDERRIKSGLLYVLKNFCAEGHLYINHEQYLKSTSEILQIEQSHRHIEHSIDNLVCENKLIKDLRNNTSLYYLPQLWTAERESIIMINKLLSQNKQISRESIIKALQYASSKQSISLSDIQQIAVEMSLKKNFLIITGGPGTGKTTTLKAVINAQKALNKKVLISSPTGRAAKRLSEVTGFDALTVHRMLEYSPQERGFRRNQETPVEAEVIIVDEASMLDMHLFFCLLKAIKLDSTLILVGDSDQLPSVGPGLVFGELIKSKRIPCVQLKSIFRQLEKSLIVKNAHLINSGKMPILTIPDGITNSDCYLVKSDDSDKTLNLLNNIINQSLPAKFGYNPKKDIQVVTPMNKGKLGTINLNKHLQQILNPPTSSRNEFNWLDTIFREGDKVVQLRNNYDIEVFNGDVGYISKILIEDQEAEIQFPQGTVNLQFEDFIDIAHAWALTVHKSQGSEYKALVMVVSTQHYTMLQRNLLYTGLTRARKTMVFLGSKKAIAIAVKNNIVKYRNTLLSSILSERES